MNLTKSQRKGVVILLAISLLLGFLILFSLASKKVIPPEIPKVNILADTSRLKRIPGVGTKRALALYNYIHTWKSLQDTFSLTDIYNFDSSLVKQILPFLEIPDSLKKNIAPENLNKISLQKLEKTSLLPPFLAQRLIAYRNKIQSFKTWEEVEKTYGITPRQVETLKKYFYLEANNSFKETPRVFVKNKEERSKILDLNKATAQDLETLPGIGKVFSRRIVKYRNLLGGYASIEQLKEVYGLPEETYEKIKNYLKVSPENIEKIPINEALPYQIMKHPYFSKKLAYRIVKYRKKYGKFQKVEDLKKIYGITDSLFLKIKPYIKL